MELSFSYRFEAAHRFLEASSKCSTPHGHTWWVTLSLEHEVSSINKDKNFSADFADLKKEWKKFIDEELDHHFFVNHQDPLLGFFSQESLRLKVTPGDPTTEVLALILFSKACQIYTSFPEITVKRVLLKETPTNSVSVEEKDLDYLKSLQPTDIWWS